MSQQALQHSIFLIGSPVLLPLGCFALQQKNFEAMLAVCFTKGFSIILFTDSVHCRK